MRALCGQATTIRAVGNAMKEKNWTVPKELRIQALTGLLLLFSASLALAQGTPIQSGQYMEGSIGPIGEADQYLFTASTNDTVNARAFSTGGQGQPHLELYDPNGNRLFADCCGRQQPALQGKLSTTGTYTIRRSEEHTSELQSHSEF